MPKKVIISQPVFIFFLSIFLSFEVSPSQKSKLIPSSVFNLDTQEISSHSLLAQKNLLLENMMHSKKNFKPKQNLTGSQILELHSKLEKKEMPIIFSDDSKLIVNSQRVNFHRQLLRFSLINSFKDIEETKAHERKFLNKIIEIETSLKKILGIGTKPLIQQKKYRLWIFKMWWRNYFEEFLTRFNPLPKLFRRNEQSLVRQTFPVVDMNLPVLGSVTKLSGEPFPKGSVPWAGIIINSEPNSPVKAVGSGEVVFASDFNALKNLVILDHGNSYLTLYGNLHSLTVTPGKLLKKSAVIGKTYGEIPNQKNGLYFEIRKNGMPVDPKVWFKY